MTTGTNLAVAEDQRARFYSVIPSLLAGDQRLVLVLAEIGAGYLDLGVSSPVAERVVNVGIREQLMVGLAGGLALAGLRPVVHTFAPFLLERPFEQVKLDLEHQGTGAVLVSAGGSYGWPQGGQTHFGHRDVALLDTLEGWTVHVPGHPDEAEQLLRRALAGSGRAYLRLDQASNQWAHTPSPDGSMAVLRRGKAGTVVAVGPMLDRVLAATTALDVTVLYASTVRPFDAATLRATLARADVVLVEPYLAGTSAAPASAALAEVPHRLLALGVGQAELRCYGTIADHDRAHGLDAAGLAERISSFLRP
jgi:transketolase